MERGIISRGEIAGWVEEQMENVLSELVRICRIRSVAEIGEDKRPPYGEGCIRVLRTMLRMGEENGFKVHNYDDTVGRITLPGRDADGEEPAESIGIWAHLDVVSEGEGWIYSPYEPVIRDGYLIARGSQDNKSSAVMGLYVLKFLAQKRIRPRRSVHLYLGTCEEAGMYDLDYFIAHYADTALPTLSLVPDCGFPVCCGERGAFNARLTCSLKEPSLVSIACDCGLYTIPDRAEAVLSLIPGQTDDLPAGEGVVRRMEENEGLVHVCSFGTSSQAFGEKPGDSALKKLLRYLTDVLAEGEARQRLRFLLEIAGDPSGRPLGVHCEDEPSGPIRLVLTRLSLREGLLEAEFVSKFPVSCNDIDYVTLASQTARAAGYSLTVTRLEKANYFNPDRGAVRLLTRISNEALDRSDTPYIMSGGTYARKLPNAIAFGTGMPLPGQATLSLPGGHGDYHQPDESIPLSRIRKSLEIYIQSVLALDELDDLLA